MTRLAESSERLSRVAIGMKKLRDQNRVARRHTPAFRAFFRRQKSLTLEVFSGYRFLFTESYRRMREETRPNEMMTTSDWSRIWEGISRDTFDDLQEIVASVEADGLKAGIDYGKSMFGGTITPRSEIFSLSNPRAVRWFQQYGGSTQYIKGINETTGNQIRTIVTKSIDKGWSYTQTAKEISDQFDEFSRDRAVRIAVHEATQAYENGNLMFARELEDDGVKMLKAWNTSNDEKVCDTCLQNESVGYIPLDEMFPSGHTVPPAHNGDRCYLTYQAA